MHLNKKISMTLQFIFESFISVILYIDISDTCRQFLPNNFFQTQSIFNRSQVRISSSQGEVPNRLRFIIYHTNPPVKTLQMYSMQ